MSEAAKGGGARLWVAWGCDVNVSISYKKKFARSGPAHLTHKTNNNTRGEGDRGQGW